MNKVKIESVSGLKNLDLVLLRNGSFYTVVDSLLINGNGFVRLRDYRGKLLRMSESNAKDIFDVVKVWRPGAECILTPKLVDRREDDLIWDADTAEAEQVKAANVPKVGQVWEIEGKCWRIMDVDKGVSTVDALELGARPMDTVTEFGLKIW